MFEVLISFYDSQNILLGHVVGEAFSCSACWHLNLANSNILCMDKEPKEDERKEE